VLLAGLDDAAVAAYLGRVTLAQLTARTVTTPDALRDELSRARADGYAIVDQELEEGLRSIAAPVRDRSGTVVAAVNVSVHASRTSVAAMRADLLPRLLAATAAIEADLRMAAASTARR
jgi:IclR family pca regulon transcriptional regulator